MNPDPTHEDPEALDPRAVRRAFARAAATYDSAAVLQREVGARMAERLDVIRIDPRAILDAGCGTGDALPELGMRYPAAQRTALDIALPMASLARQRHGERRSAMARLAASLRGKEAPPVHFVAGDIAALPFAAASFDLVWSNLALQWVNDTGGALAELHRTLRVGGLLMFTTLGPDTLRELRAAFRRVDARPHVSRFLDMHDVGDLLVHAGFADPVMHMERLTLTYREPRAMMRDLKLLGATNASRARRRGLFGRERWQRALSALDAMRVDDRIPATFEIVYGHAWKAAPTRTAEGLPIVRLERGSRRGA
ncbi:MAG TPA: malonyl-ACP O-methyltransferase BioC [Casimicrobiaceae bacterium]|nr:malonyl-ACP O-methyltransferase BioC [Casimicrobiaceae bacterium]